MKDQLKNIEELVVRYSQIDGAHHKMWVLDQILRELKGDDYDQFIHDYEYSDVEDNPTEELEYTWDTGVAP